MKWQYHAVNRYRQSHTDSVTDRQTDRSVVELAQTYELLKEMGNYAELHNTTAREKVLAIFAQAPGQIIAQVWPNIYSSETTQWLYVALLVAIHRVSTVSLTDTA